MEIHLKKKKQTKTDNLIAFSHFLQSVNYLLQELQKYTSKYLQTLRNDEDRCENKHLHAKLGLSNRIFSMRLLILLLRNTVAYFQHLLSLGGEVYLTKTSMSFH